MKAGSKRPKHDAPAKVKPPDDAELPPTWCISNLEAITDPKRPICYGILMPKENVADGVPYVKVKDIKGGRVVLESLHRTSSEIASKYKRSSLRPGDLLLSIRGTYGRVAPVPEELDGGNITQDTARLAIVPEVDPKFISYQLNSNSVQNYFKQVARGVAVKGVNIADVKLTPIRLAPLTEQHRIVAAIEEHFTRLNAGIAALEGARARLRRYRASVLKAACEGRLVPTEAELARAEGRDYEPADRLLARILQHRRSRWEADQLAKLHAQGKPPKDDRWKARYEEPADDLPDNLPDLPEGWAWTTIGRAFEVFVGATPSRSKPEFWGGPIRWVSSGEVAFCSINNTRETITDLGLANSSTSVHPPGTVLLGMIGEGKTRGQAAILRVPACNNQNCAAIRVSEAGLPPEFVYQYLEGQYEETRTLGSGNNQPALNKSRVQRMPIPLPPLAEQHRIVAEVDRRLSLVDDLDAALAAGLKRADRLRQAILKRAFAGRLVPQDPADEPASALLERIRTGGAVSLREKNDQPPRPPHSGRNHQPSLFD